MSLSTANPSIGGSVPELGVQLLKFKRVYITRKAKNFTVGRHAIPTIGLNMDMYDPTIEDSYGGMEE